MSLFRRDSSPKKPCRGRGPHGPCTVPADETGMCRLHREREQMFQEKREQEGGTPVDSDFGKRVDTLLKNPAELLSLRREVAQAKALVASVLERGGSPLTCPHCSGELVFPEIDKELRRLEAVGKQVERLVKIEQGEKIVLEGVSEALNSLLPALIGVVTKYVPDAHRKALASEIRQSVSNSFGGFSGADKSEVPV